MAVCSVSFPRSTVGCPGWVDLWSEIVAFSGHTHLLFVKEKLTDLIEQTLNGEDSLYLACNEKRTH